MPDRPLRSEFVEVPIPQGASALSHVADWLTAKRVEGYATVRWGLVALRESVATVEVCFQPVDASHVTSTADSTGTQGVVPSAPVALVVPTGVGASIGGFIGDAGAVNRAFEAAADPVITHPNVLNGADLYGGDRALFVDGYTLDEFFAGSVRLLRANTGRRIGVLLDLMPPLQIDLLKNAINAARSVWGVNVIGYAICRSRVRSSVAPSSFDHFVGEVENPDVLYEAAHRLVDAGADVIAAVTAIEGIAPEHWRAHYIGCATNPVGALEALISRAITWKLGVPCAHAPAFAPEMGQSDQPADPRAAAELISRTGLPCVLRGLAHASLTTAHDGIGVRDLAAIVVPHGCAGGMPALGAERFGVPLVAVRANRCRVGVSTEELRLARVTVVENYAEAIAFVVARRAGVAWDTLRGSVAPLQEF